MSISEDINEWAGSREDIMLDSSYWLAVTARFSGFPKILQ